MAAHTIFRTESVAGRQLNLARSTASRKLGERLTMHSRPVGEDCPAGRRSLSSWLLTNDASAKQLESCPNQMNTEEPNNVDTGVNGLCG